MDLFYAFIGVTHFTLTQDLHNICPGRGAWGFWCLPGNSSFHVKWSGIVEIMGGLSLAAAGLGLAGSASAELLLRRAALVLFALTVAVTPANV